MSDRDTTAIAETLRAAAGHLRAGRFGEAEAMARRAVEARPEHPDALHILGVATAQGGLDRFRHAARRRALRDRP